MSGAELQGGGRFPGLGEAVDADQLVGAGDGGELGEQPAASDGLELAGVADEHEAPVVASARLMSWWRDRVPIMLASSTTTVVAVGSR